MHKQVNQSINDAVVGHMAGGVVKVDNSTTINQVNHYTGKHTHHHQHAHTHHHSHQHDHVHNVRTSGPVVIHHATVVQQPPSFALVAPPAPPARSRGSLTKARPEVTPAQRAVLALMRPLPKPQRIAVLDWMRCEFGTALVMDLDPRELYRLRTHLAEVRRVGGMVGG